MALRTRARLLAVAAATASLLPLAATPAWAEECYTYTRGGDSAWYHGPSASVRYDDRTEQGGVGFSRSGFQPATDDTLQSYVPQGLATWRNWDNAGNDLLVYTAYSRSGGRAVVQGINPATKVRTPLIPMMSGHAGGLAFSNGYMWVTSGPTLYRYSMDTVRTAFQGGMASLLTTDHMWPVRGGSFLSAHDGQLFTGPHETGQTTGERYQIVGGVPDIGAPTIFGVPPKAQGLAVTSTHFIWSTSLYRNYRSNVWVVRRGHAPGTNGQSSCFRAPTMMEGATLYDGKVWFLFESASAEYPDALNRIPHLHKVSTANLLNLVP